MTLEQVAIRVAWSYIGTPYIWGGDDPRGFDCSGLVIECLQSVGVFPRGQDTTADGLMRRYRAIEAEDAGEGDLVFWTRSNGRAFHVGIVIAPGLYIGAEGGGSWATNPGEALARNAYIRVRPYGSRGDANSRKFADPFHTT